jgi:pimeloyl-ACP methyl ester carboxylesterase
MYVHDYGAPVGWRLALSDPAAVTAIISCTNPGRYPAAYSLLGDTAAGTGLIRAGVTDFAKQSLGDVIASRHWDHQYPPFCRPRRSVTTVCTGELTLAPSTAGPKASPPPQPTDNMDHPPGATADRVWHPRGNHD